MGGVELLLAELQNARTSEKAAQLTYLRAAEKEARRLADEKPALLRKIEDLRKENKRLQNVIDHGLKGAPSKSHVEESMQDTMSLRSFTFTPHEGPKASTHPEAGPRIVNLTDGS